MNFDDQLFSLQWILVMSFCYFHHKIIYWLPGSFYFNIISIFSSKSSIYYFCWFKCYKHRGITDNSERFAYYSLTFFLKSLTQLIINYRGKYTLHRKLRQGFIPQDLAAHLEFLDDFTKLNLNQKIIMREKKKTIQSIATTGSLKLNFNSFLNRKNQIECSFSWERCPW